MLSVKKIALVPLVSFEGYSLYRPLLKLDVTIGSQGHNRTNRELARYTD